VTGLRHEQHGVRIPSDTRDIFPSRKSKPDLEKTEVQGALISAGVNRPEREADHSPPGVQVKSECNYTSIPNIRLHRVCGEHLPIQLLKIIYKCLYIH